MLTDTCTHHARTYTHRGKYYIVVVQLINRSLTIFLYIIQYSVCGVDWHSGRSSDSTGVDTPLDHCSLP